MSSSVLNQHLHHLIALHLVVPAGGETYSFRHALTREAVYATILRRERRDAHFAVASALEAVLADQRDEEAAALSYHYFEAGAWERAQMYARRAGRRIPFGMP